MRLKLTSQQSTLLVAETQAHIEKKNHLKINRPSERNY